MRSERELRSALELSGSLSKELIEKLRGVDFYPKDKEGKTRYALLEFATDDDAQTALRILRKNGLNIEGKPVYVGQKIGPGFTEAHFIEEKNRLKIEEEEDPAGVILRQIEEGSNQMPDLEQVRSILVDEDNDRWDFLRMAKMPGLTKPEWLHDDDPYIRMKREHEEARAAEEQDDAEDPHPSEVLGRWAETIVRIDRVQKVVKGGNITKYRALVVIGNLMGAGGYSYGKGVTPQDAVARASRKAKQDLHFIERFKGCALAHDVKGKFNSCIVNIFATPPGYGARGSILGRAILKQLGFSSFTIKAHGRRTPSSYVYATFDALAQLQSPEDMARARGRRLFEIESRMMTGRRWPPNYRRFD
mmetsp:Transcript_18597/g.22832  ORF Transcript_18597/g.22832 Transcript_18597/m.22832 type:complete len:361 (+) Transcript_18597:3-1085(+)